MAAGGAMVAAAAVAVIVIGRGGAAHAELARPFDPTALSAVAPKQPAPPIDTSIEGWYEPYMEADAKLERGDQTVNGLSLGPSTQSASFANCAPGEAEELGASSLKDIEWGIAKPEVGYLPAGAIEDYEAGLSCRESLVWYSISFRLPLDEGDASRVRSGDLSWFEARHGGFVEVRRSRLDSPVFNNNAPTARVSEGSVSGRPGVIVAPVIKGGFGEGSVTVWDGTYLTQVNAMHLSAEEMVKVAEGVK
jgi:hypothetical protein